MMITRNNLNKILFENQDTRLLIEYVVSHTQATINPETIPNELYELLQYAYNEQRGFEPAYKPSYR